MATKRKRRGVDKVKEMIEKVMEGRDCQSRSIVEYRKCKEENQKNG